MFQKIIKVKNVSGEMIEAGAPANHLTVKMPGHFETTKSLIRYGKLYGVSRFPFEPNWLLRKRIMKVIRGVDQKAQSMRF